MTVPTIDYQAAVLRPRLAWPGGRGSWGSPVERRHRALPYLPLDSDHRKVREFRGPVATLLIRSAALHRSRSENMP